MGFSFPALYFTKKNPGVEVMQYKHSPDESGDLGGRILQEKGQCWFYGEFFRGEHTFDRRGVCLFMKFFSDTTISYQVVRGTPILLNTAGVRRKWRSSTGGTFAISWTLF